MSIKQMLGCCLCICLIVGACGCAQGSDTIETPTNAPMIWRSNTGKMEIYLANTQMLRPETKQLYLIDVTSRLFDKGEILRVLQAFQPEAMQIDAEYAEPFKDNLYLYIGNERFTLTASGRRNNGTWADVQVKCTLNNDTHLTGSMQLLQRVHDGSANHCRYSPEEARMIADAAAASIAADYAFSAWGLTELYPKDGSDTGIDDYDYIEGYRFCYTPVIDGIHVPYTPDEDEGESLTLLSVRLPRLYVTVMDSGLYEICWEGAQDTGEKALVTALLPDEHILSIAQSVLPLAYIELEQHLGDDAALMVDRIQLSYCRAQRRDKPGHYVLTPVWDFFGYRAQENRDGTFTSLELNPNTVLLTVNAIDGTVIDRKYGY